MQFAQQVRDADDEKRKCHAFDQPHKTNPMFTIQ